LQSLLHEATGVPSAEFAPLATHTHDEQAVAHLCRVATGLDSMILGEPQILGQVTEAYQLATGQNAIGPVLSALFRTAIRAGKRARTETGISRNPATISSVAVRMSEHIIGDVADKHVVVIGAGEMAELAVEALRARGARHITVVNRTHEHAHQLAQRWAAHAVTFEALIPTLANADIAIVSTGAPHYVVTPNMVQSAMETRATRPLVLMDIAVPRNVSPEVTQTLHVHAYDIDDLQTHLTDALAERQQAVPHVEAIIVAEVTAFELWLRGLDIAPLITDLRSKAETIRRAEIERTLRHLPELSPEAHRHIEILTEALVNKLLHEPTTRLRAASDNGHAAEYAQTVRHLFGLSTRGD
jgi:glutamyl-tRNA reductase